MKVVQTHKRHVRPTDKSSGQADFVEYLNRLSLGETNDRQAKLFHAIVRQQLRAVGSFEVAYAPDGRPSIESTWSRSKLAGHPEFRDQMLEVCNLARQSRSIQMGQPQGYELTTLAAPVVTLDEVRRIWLVVIPRDERRHLTVSRDFEAAARYYGLWNERRLGSEADQRLTTMARVIDFVTAMQRHETVEQASQSLVAEVAKLPGVNSVALATQHGARLKMVAVSGHASFLSNGKGSSAYLEACKEARLRAQGFQTRSADPSKGKGNSGASGESTASTASGAFGLGLAIWPPESDDARHCLLAHEQLAAFASDPYAATQCLVCEDGSLTGVLVWAGDTSHHDEHAKLTPVDRTTGVARTSGGVSNAARAANERHTQLLSASSVPLAETLRSVTATQRGPISRFVKRAAKLTTQAAGWLAMAGAMAAIGLMFVPLPYKVRCVCKAEPVTRRFAVAPYQGIVERGFVKAGDVVGRGDVLARMDPRELHWELASVTAEQQRAMKERNVYLAGDQVPQAMMARMDTDRFTSRRDLLEHREQNLEIRSPIDGFILSGDLERNENAPVEMGEALYEIGPCSPIKFQLFVPADDVLQIQAGHTARMWIEGLGTEPVAANLVRVLPRSREFEGQNVFVAEVEIANEDTALRPGMRGIARITCDTRPMGWNLFHKPWEYVCSRLHW